MARHATDHSLALPGVAAGVAREPARRPAGVRDDRQAEPAHWRSVGGDRGDGDLRRYSRSE